MSEGDEPAFDPDKFRPASDPQTRSTGHRSRHPGSTSPPNASTPPRPWPSCAARWRKLPNAQREVITLRDIQGWTSAEVCNTLDITETNQRVLLHRGRSKVRAALELYFESTNI